jgi:hypothetical protein
VQVVDARKKFIDIYVGLLKSVNNFQVLPKLSLYRQAQYQYQGLFNMEKGNQDGFSPYLLGDKGYQLPPWIMTPHKEGQQHFILEVLYNNKHKF